MRILIAEDDLVPRRVLERTLQEMGHETVVTCDGLAAWDVLSQEDAPKLAILDWMMPCVDGAELCRRVRALNRIEPTYIILLTARVLKDDIAKGLDSGADDYLTKPFDRQELQSRIRVGERMIALQRGLAERVRELEQALTQVKQLKGLLPICSYCKKIRDDRNYWQQVESYIMSHTDAYFSHGICPCCWDTVVVPEMVKAGVPAAEIPFPSRSNGEALPPTANCRGECATG